MALLNPNEIFTTAFEPKIPNRFIMYMEGIPSYLVKGVSAMGYSNDEIVLNHMNIYRKISGSRQKWNDITLKLFDPIVPSGAQAVMEWARLHAEPVTGRRGYSDFYKRDLTFNVVGPVGDVVSEWIIEGAFIKSATFGDYSWDTENAASEIDLVVGMDRIILNY
jgi:hypothetical protein